VITLGPMKRAGTRAAWIGTGSTLADKQLGRIKTAVEVPTERRGSGGIKHLLQVLQVLVGTFASVKNGQALRGSIRELNRDIDTCMV